MDIIYALLDLLLPRRCAGCSTPGVTWCARCGAAAGLLSVHRTVLAGIRAYAALPYAGPARKLVLAYKERHRRELATPIGQILAAAVPRVLTRESLTPRCVLVPAPSRPAALRRRGGNHMTLAATHAATTLRTAGVDASVAPLLHLHRSARDSTTLSAPARATNLHNRVHVTTPTRPPTAPLLFIDDVITTGTTAATCVNALKSAGLPVAAALALTVTL
ncbi:ComF family protein [Actinokineospora sp. NPDC004072]